MKVSIYDFKSPIFDQKKKKNKKNYSFKRFSKATSL